MNIEHFLTELKIQLRALTPTQVSTILTHYRKQYDLGKEKGLTEHEILKELGQPSTIASDILQRLNIPSTSDINNNQGWQELNNKNQVISDYHDHYDEKKPSMFSRFLQIAGVLFINLFFMIWILFAIAMVLFAGWITSLSFIASPFIILAALVTPFVGYPSFSIFATVLLFGIGILGLTISKTLTVYFAKFIKYYAKMNFGVLKGV